MLSGMTKTDKLHLFADRNLKSLTRLYNWSGQQKQKDIVRTKKKKNESDDDDEEVKHFLRFFFISKISFSDGSRR